MLKGKHIVLGITGSIAAYKACLIIRALVKRGAEVQVVITPAGKEFITPSSPQSPCRRLPVSPSSASSLVSAMGRGTRMLTLACGPMPCS